MLLGFIPHARVTYEAAADLASDMAALVVCVLVASLRKNEQGYREVVMIMWLAGIEADRFAKQVLGCMHVSLVVTRTPLHIYLRRLLRQIDYLRLPRFNNHRLSDRLVCPARRHHCPALDRA